MDARLLQSALHESANSLFRCARQGRPLENCQGKATLCGFLLLNFFFKALPQLYRTGLFDQEFNLAIFLGWLFRGFAESCMIFFVCYFVFAEDIVVPDGTNAGLWAMGLTAASAVVLVVTTKLALYVNNWTIWQAGIMVLSVLIFYIFLILVAVLSVRSCLCLLFSSADFFLCKGTSNSAMIGLATQVLTWPSYWLAVFLCVMLSAVPELIWMTAQRWFFPADWQVAQYLQGETRKVKRFIQREKPVPKRLLKNITVLEMARALEGVDPATAYSGFAYSGTPGGRTTLALSLNIKPGQAKF